MSEISFSSTYRIPVMQQGINSTKKMQLKSLITSYNGIVGTGNTGYARVSMGNDKDIAFIRKLKDIGYRVYQQFRGENIGKNNLDEYINKCLENRDYMQYGKQNVQARGSHRVISQHPNTAGRESKNIELVNSVNLEEQEKIRKTKSYKDTVEKYGKEFAEAVFFL